MFTIKVHDKNEARALWRACNLEVNARTSGNRFYWRKDEDYKESKRILKCLNDVMDSLEREFNLTIQR